jgi:hypothetical protein
MALVPSTVHAVTNSKTCIVIICLLTCVDHSLPLCSSEEPFPSLVIDLSVLVHQNDYCLIES